MKNKLICTVVFSIAAFAPAFADSIDVKAGCKTNPAVVAACYTIRGRIFASNGTPSLRISPIGAKRILGILPAENEIMPDNIKGKVTFEQSALATLEVCPFTENHPGAMQSVCVESATDVVLHPSK